MTKWGLSLAALLFSSWGQSSELSVELPDGKVETLSMQTIEQALPKVSFTTSLPWFKEAKKYTGVPAEQLLKYYDINDASAMSFIALNDYAATTVIEDIENYHPVIVYKLDDQKMRIREKGPFWLVFNLDKYPQLNNELFYSQMVWQIDKIIIHRDNGE
ncbi:hypothetical protein [Vibrio sp.]|uniref:hypothetical protein n=1 Tax=Vibrio sp. TaxID=678 RepID=UPI003D0D9D0D